MARSSAWSRSHWGSAPPPRAGPPPAAAEPAAAADRIESCEQELTKTIDELRELARGIHPAVLTDRGLEPALRALCCRCPIPGEVGELPEERLPAQVESAASLVISEGLANAARYASAPHATVSVARQNGHPPGEGR